MSPASTPSTAPSAPTTSSVVGGSSGTPNTATSTVNKQTGQSFQNATTGPYTLQNANAAASGGISPVTGLSTSKANPLTSALGAPMQPLSYFVQQTG